MGRSAANAFDIPVWARATGLMFFGMELFVSRGSATVSLRHIAPDGRETEYAVLDCPQRGSAFSPPIQTADLPGVLLPVVQTVSADAVFDLYFGSNDMPPNPFGRVAFLLENSTGSAEQAISVFRRYLDAHEERDAPDASHLLVVDSASALSRSADPAVTILANDRTGGADPFGRGLYALCYGALAEQGFTHVCLLQEGLHLHPEMFARTAAFSKFIRPNVHASAPVYAPAEAAEADRGHPGARCLGFGRAAAAGLFEQAESPQGGLDPAAISAFLAADRMGGQVDMHWCCFDLQWVYRIGLPFPFLDRAGRQEYAARLRQSGARFVAPMSFWAQKTRAAAPPGPLHKDWAARAMQGGLNDHAVVCDAFDAALQAERDNPDARGALVEEMEVFLAGPERLAERAVSSMPARLRRPPLVLRDFLFARRLKHQRRALEDLPTLTSAYIAARDRMSTATYWAQMADNCPPADPALSRPGMATAAIKQQKTLSSLHLKMDMQLRRQQSTMCALQSNLEERLERNRLLDHSRVLADQDRANRTVLSLLRHRHRGQRAVIIGNGTSLEIDDLTRLQGEVTFASNKIYLAYDQTPWRPTYYSVEDHLVILHNWDRIATLEGSIKIFPENVRDFGFHAADTIFVPFRPPRSFENPLSDPAFPEFSDDLSHGICWGSTIIYSQIQMALYMGCSEIVLIGMDHSYKLPSTRHGRLYKHEGERNHFHPEYRKPGEWWHQPNLEVLEVSYARAHERCTARGVRILNASRYTRLDIFERADFDTLFPPEKENA